MLGAHETQDYLIMVAASLYFSHLFTAYNFSLGDQKHFYINLHLKKKKSSVKMPLFIPDQIKVFQGFIQRK